MPTPWEATVPPPCDPSPRDHRQILQKLRAKKEIITRLITGRLPLLEAAAQFVTVQAERSADAESMCRQVIGWAYLALGDRPERAEAFSAQLEGELAQHLSRHGELQLPVA